ncbi:MAG TPA: UvrD-helicase domain-containing protein [Stellaceae bacterium]|nr:UvrD-helicase domain-containing protein [Stellaceae bacterium]
MTKALVFSLPAAHRFHAGIALAENWSDTLVFDAEDAPLLTVKHKDVSYVFRTDEDKIGPSIVIRIEPGKLFLCFGDNDSRLEALRRAVQAGVLVLDGSGQLPDYWRPFSGGKYVTFQAQSLSKADQRRLAMWRRLSGDRVAYVFDITRTQKDYNTLNPDFDLLGNVLSERRNALALRVNKSTKSLHVGPTTLNLSDLPEQVDTVVQGWKLTYLYERRLTKRQREFVDADLDRPIRLKGAAGTGKSLAMVAKLLREATVRKAEAKPYRFLFLTHNASAAELAVDYAIALDENDLILSSQNDQLIRIDTLLGLAIHDLSEDLGDLRPISNDAHEGKKLQLIILSDIVKVYQHGAWITQRSTTSEATRKAFEAPPDSPSHEEFCWDLMNEIACVLDAEGVRDNQAKREAYVKERRRPRYLMPLESTGDRELILALYDQYRASLRREGFISVDQLVADYLGYLDSFRWDARRQRLGYDAIFVDEYHLFNRIERAAFPSLMRNAEAEWPILLMALDPRQSPRAVFVEAAFGTDDSAIPLAAGQAKQLRDFEFSDVFRYTPEIAHFLAYVNHHFPESDLSEEWLPGLAKSALPSGQRPVASEFAGQLEVYDGAVSAAERLQRQSGRGKTAIITLSHKSFDVITKASRYADRLYVVDSRESLNRLQYVGSRIVFSMPEYVAGVQFDHVIVADVNERDDIGRPSSLGRSRFGSNLYLAASRARQSVTLIADLRSGGLAPVIKGAVHEGIVLQHN